MTRAITLSDKYELDRGRVYMTGIQALLRIALDQRVSIAVLAVNPYMVACNQGAHLLDGIVHASNTVDCSGESPLGRASLPDGATAAGGASWAARSSPAATTTTRRR